MFTEQDVMFMQHAIKLAKQAQSLGEVPVGAVLVLDNRIIGEGYNCPISQNNPAAHAEMMALQQGARHVGNYRLLDTTLYVTLEPCLMCAGVMVHARIKMLIYGAHDPKAGVVVSQDDALAKPFLNHKITYRSGLLENECSHLLTNFFREKRKG